jgi:putative toxin-antitoxin system antitoxin component (TIGR02293 family)
MTEEARILKLLGAGKRRRNDLVEMTRQGIASTTAKQVLSDFGLNPEQATVILGTSPRTLARRVQRNQSLDPVESDRLVRFLRVAAHAEEVFEDRDRALEWLKAPNRALGGTVPLDLLDTDAGTELVDEILHRVDYGVYS